MITTTTISTPKPIINCCVPGSAGGGMVGGVGVGLTLTVGDGLGATSVTGVGVEVGRLSWRTG